jgi:DNA modification methylase
MAKAARNGESAKDGASLIIHHVPIDILNPAPYNPRRLTEKQAADLTESIKRFGMVDPLVVNTFPGREHIVVGGHQRLNICRLLGHTTVPVVLVSLPEEKERELNLRLNRNTGEWDWDMLAEFDLPMLRDVGFTDEELVKNFDIDLDAEDPRDKPPDTPAPERVKHGETWRCGDHLITCGDSTVAESYAIAPAVDFVFTSPPYNVDIDYDIHWDSFKNRDEYLGLIRAVAELFMPLLKPGRVVGWQVGVSPKTAPHRHICILEDLGATLLRSIVWKKGGVGIPNMARQQFVRKVTQNYVHELIVLLSKGDIEKGSPIPVADAMSCDVVHIAAAPGTRDIPTVSHVRSNGTLPKNRIKAHPATFPVALPREFLRLYTEPGEVVLDPFAGAGTTMLACEELGRLFRGVELSPRYVDLALWRWEKAYGKTAQRVGPAKPAKARKAPKPKAPRKPARRGRAAVG